MDHRATGGKACCLPAQTGESNSTSKSKEDSQLFIEKLARENDAAMGKSAGDKMLTSVSGINQSDAESKLGFGGEDQVDEVIGEVDPALKVYDDYLVHLPSPDCDDEIVPTSPLVPEVNMRFNRRNAQENQKNVVDKEKHQAMKRNLEGLQPTGDAEKLRQGAGMIKSNTMKLMKLCEDSRRARRGRRAGLLKRT